MSIGLACNFYREANALPGLLENAAQWADDMIFLHCPPHGDNPDDESIAIIEKFGARWMPHSIEEGFGAVRTALIRASTTEWVAILDADERFHPRAPMLSCSGDEKYPEVEEPKLKVIQEGVYDQLGLLKKLMEMPEVNGIRTARRHWFDFTWKNPCQNWTEIPDWQLRIVRNIPEIHYRSNVKMHEQIRGCEKFGGVSESSTGVFHDHYHCFFKPMEKEQREEDIAIYNRLHAEGHKEPGIGACAM